MDDAGEIAAQREQDIQPELKAETHLQENADRRQDDGEQNANDVHDLKSHVHCYRATNVI